MSEFEVRGGEFSAPVHDHDDDGGFVERDARLTKNFCGDEIFFLRQDAAGIDDAKVAAAPFSVSIETIARNTRFVADNSATRANDTIEERGFADVRAAYDRDSWRRSRIGRFRFHFFSGVTGCRLLELVIIETSNVVYFAARLA